MIEENMLRGSLTSTQEAKGAMAFKGETGMSAYELAVKNGYEGTEQEWINHFGLDLSGYVKTSDVVDNLTSTNITKPLSAKQGKTLKENNDTTNTNIGTLSGLTTTDKTNIVAAINELNARNNYSTNETVVGTWIDDKPIYRKVINFGNLPNNAIKDVAHNISNLDQSVNLRAIGYRSAADTYYPIPYYTFESTYSMQLYASSTNVTIRTSVDRSDITAYVIIEYTKTTD